MLGILSASSTSLVLQPDCVRDRKNSAFHFYHWGWFKMRKICFRVISFSFIAMLGFLLVLQGCRKAVVSEPESVRVFSQLLPENYLFFSEDGGIWCLDHRERQNDGEPERLVVQRYGPVCLQKTEDIGKSLSLHITGLVKSDPPISTENSDWWYLGYTYEVGDKKLKSVSLSLQIQLDGRWYILPSSGLTPDQPDLINLMRGRLYPDQTEQIIPGHYRLVLLRNWRGDISLDVKEFDLTERGGEYYIESVQEPSNLFSEKTTVPDKNILRADGSSWRLVEAGSQDFWNIMTDIIEIKVP